MKYCSSFKHLGHILNNDLQDNDDIMSQTSAIYALWNKLVNSFKHCTEDISKIFKTHISNFYITQIWCTYNVNVYKKFTVAYNNVFRILFKLDRRCSVRQEMTQRNIDTCDMVQRKLVYRMYNRVLNASNPILQNMMRSDLCFDSKLLWK